MKSRTLLLLYCSILSTTFFCKAQSLDSLKVILTSKDPDSLIIQKASIFFKADQNKLLPLELAECYHEYGKWWYKNSRKKSENLDRAITYTSKAVTLKKDNKASKESLKKSLYNLGFFCSLSGYYTQAIQYYKEIKDLFDVGEKTFYVLSELANTYMMIGDYQKSILNLDLLISESQKSINHNKWLILAYLNRAELYALMSRKKFSKKIKNDIDKIDLLLKKYKGNSTSYYNRLYQIEGNRLLENGYPNEAIPYFSMILKNITEGDLYDKAVVNNSLGQSYFKLKEYDNALLHFNKAIDYDPIYTTPYENRGDLYIERSNLLKGIEEYQKAINILLSIELGVEDKVEIENLEQVKKKYHLLHHLIQKAKGWVQFYKTEKKQEYLRYALETFKTADQLIDIIRFESTEHKSKLYWREQGASLYVGAVEVCFLLNKPEEAFYFMEKNKAILLLEDISNYQAIENAKLPLTLANKEVQLKKQINTFESQLQRVTAKKEDTKDSLQRQLYLSKRAYATFIDSLVVAYPEYGKYKRQIPIISYEKAEIIANTQNTLFLQYITTDAKGYGMLIGGAKPIVFEITNANTLPKDLEGYQNIVTQKFVTTEQQQAFCTIANRLFQKLIPQGIYEELKGKQVIIIPDYRLQELSFETLTTSKTTTNYLLKEAEISYAYSISYLENNNNLTRDAKESFLAVAPVDFESLQLPSLHYTNTEANALATIFSGNLLLNNQATKTSFLDQGGNYKALHLATHAKVGNSIDPWIAFHDHKLSLQELYGYKNQHDLVTLSACKTSLGELKLGEGVMSLTRGFFYGGAKSVVSSLWATNDKANQQIMVSFYEQLKEGVSKSKALRQAKLNYLKTHQGTEASPLYWGGNILVGDVASINLTNSFFSGKLKLVVILVGLLLILWISWFFLKLKKKMKE